MVKFIKIIGFFLIISIFFSTLNASAQSDPWYQLQLALENNDPKLKWFIDTLYEMKYKKFFSEINEITKICAAFYHYKNNWHYKDDPGKGDLINDPTITIQSGLIGDCDDFAVLMAAAIRIMGKRSRVVLGHNQEVVGHAYTEMFVGRSAYEAQAMINNIIKKYAKIYNEINVFKVYARNDANGYWLNFDWFAKYPSGTYYPATKEVVLYSDGTVDEFNAKTLPEKKEFTVDLSSPSTSETKELPPVENKTKNNQTNAPKSFKNFTQKLKMLLTPKEKLIKEQVIEKPSAPVELPLAIKTKPEENSCLLDNIKVDGIIYTKNNPSARINGEPYFIGDLICDGKIVDISQDAVSIQTKEGIKFFQIK